MFSCNCVMERFLVFWYKVRLKCRNVIYSNNGSVSYARKISTLAN